MSIQRKKGENFKIKHSFETVVVIYNRRFIQEKENTYYKYFSGLHDGGVIFR
jgi:hypothetical protein